MKGIGMINAIKKFSSNVELSIVLILGFGLFIYSSTYSFLLINSNYSYSWTHKLTDHWNYFIVIYEVIVLSIIIYMLKLRGWRIADFNLEFSFRLIWIAILLVFIKNFIGNSTIALLEYFKAIDDTALSQVKFSFEASFISAVLIIVINSIYEELLLIGYLFKRLINYHPVIIIGISLIIRVLYHTYQGWTNALFIIPTGLVFGFYYYRYKKLWPVILSHAFSNTIAFLNMYYEWYK